MEILEMKETINQIESPRHGSLTPWAGPWPFRAHWHVGSSWQPGMEGWWVLEVGEAQRRVQLWESRAHLISCWLQLL